MIGGSGNANHMGDVAGHHNLSEYACMYFLFEFAIVAAVSFLDL